MLTPLVDALLDRDAGRRADADYVAARMVNALWIEVDDEGRVRVAEAGDCLLAHTQSAAAGAAAIAKSADADRYATGTVYLGDWGGRSLFARSRPAIQPKVTPEPERWIDGRAALSFLAPAQAGLASYARGMLHWQRSHRFCGRCAAPTVSADAGHSLVCSAADCRQQIFPRLDPAAIVAVIDGDRLLLGRQAQWPPRRFSLLAGFVEIGESVEAAAIREVREEVGLEITGLRYLRSQAWPFPASLMLGFSASVCGGTLSTSTEIEAVAFFERGELDEAVAAGTLQLSNPASIAGALIERWRAGSPLGQRRRSSLRRYNQRRSSPV